MRWTTSVGIVLGGTGGAIAALMGAPQDAPAPRPPAPRTSTASAPAPSEAPAPPAVESSAAVAPPPSAAPAASAAPSTAPSAAASAGAPAATPTVSVPTDMPTTTEALMKAMLYCDQKQDFDACTRAAFALDLGSAGPADPEQAKRFRKIAMTHLVKRCEGGWAHACFVLAAKYRAGTELPKNESGAAILEKRAVDLCRHNSAPECPQ